MPRQTNIINIRTVINYFASKYAFSFSFKSPIKAKELFLCVKVNQSNYLSDFIHEMNLFDWIKWLAKIKINKKGKNDFAHNTFSREEAILLTKQE